MMERADVWAMFYASVQSMGLHPGSEREGGHKMTPQEGARIADDMLREYHQRWVNPAE